jgi:hypothetical protein
VKESVRGVTSNTNLGGEPYALKGARTVRRKPHGDLHDFPKTTAYLSSVPTDT